MANRKQVTTIVLDTFAIDKARIITLFEQTGALFDPTELSGLLNKYKDDITKFAEIKGAIQERAMIAYCARYKINKTAIEVHDILTSDKTLAESDKPIRKSAYNAWFYVCNKCGITSATTTSGVQRKGSGASHKDKMNAAGKAQRAAAAQVAAMNETNTVPVVLTTVAEACSDLISLKSAYATAKAHIIKLQARNANLYTGDEGSKLLTAHQAIVDAFKAIV